MVSDCLNPIYGESSYRQLAEVGMCVCVCVCVWVCVCGCVGEWVGAWPTQRHCSDLSIRHW